MMQHEELIRSVEVSASERIVEIRRRGEREIENILKEANAKAADIRKKHQEDAVRAVEVERNKQISSVKKDVRMEILQAKAELLDSAFRRAEVRLTSIRNNGSYPAIFRNLLLETLQEMKGEDFELHVDRRDADLCRAVLQDLNTNCDILPDLQCSGGLIARSEDGHLVVQNTIESRLVKGREALRLEIFPHLYGDTDGL